MSLTPGLLPQVSSVVLLAGGVEPSGGPWVL